MSDNKQPETFLNRIISIPKVNADASYNAGYDCGINGANENNCGIQFFATKEKMQAWERGKKNAEIDKRNSNGKNKKRRKIIIKRN